jgi:hydrogenase maturation protease HycI
MESKKAIVSVGNPLKADDNIGNLILDRIKHSYKNKEYYFFKGGMNPENFIEPLKKINPDWIFFIDVALFEGEVGDVKIFKLEDIIDMNISTHYFPISVFKKYFPKTKLVLIGIKPKFIDFSEELSPELKEKLPKITEKIQRTIEAF